MSSSVTFTSLSGIEVNGIEATTALLLDETPSNVVEQAGAEVFLNKAPVFIQVLVVFGVFLWNLVGVSLHLFVLVEELLEYCNVETPCLFVYERCLQEHGVGSCPDYVVKLVVGYRKAELFSLVLYEFGGHVSLPHLVFDLVLFCVAQCRLTPRELYRFGVLFDHRLVFVDT